MELDKMLTAWAEESAIAPREEAVMETAARCREGWLDQESGYGEFLWSQLRYTRKRWWAMQGGLLLLAGQMLSSWGPHLYQVRTLGVFGCLFVVLLIPELWRNKACGSTQVEAACLYSLRQVYAARITLFGLVDVSLLTAFAFELGRMGISPVEILSQFLLPVTVTACICFSLLCGKGNCNEAVSLTACLSCGGAWWLVMRNEAVYTRIVPPVWAGLFVLSLAFLALAVRKTLGTTNQYWEEVLA